MNIKEVLSAPRSPWQRAYVERVIGSIRRECLDHVIILDEEGLRRVLSSYVRYYHGSRLHLSLDKDSITPLLAVDVISVLMTREAKEPVRDTPLTSRQREVVQLLAEGKTKKEAAALLGISTRTAESHKYEVMRQLGVTSTAALIRYAIRVKLVTT